MNSSRSVGRHTAISDFFAIPDEFGPPALGSVDPAGLGAKIENAPVGIVVFDDALRIRHLNAMARPIFAALGDVIGREWLEILRMHWPADTAEAVVRFGRRALETGIGYSSLNFSEMRADLGTEEVYHWDIHLVYSLDGSKWLACYFVGPLTRSEHL